MSWWTTAIYDTCSLITFDKLLQESRSLARCFPKKLLVLEPPGAEKIHPVLFDTFVEFAPAYHEAPPVALLSLIDK